MDYQNELVRVKERIEKAKDILVVTHANLSFDNIGSSLALGLALTSLGKHVTVACSEPMTVELSGFVGVNKIVSSIGKKNFIISLDYVDGSIEKVSYNIEGNRFNLVVEPRNGFVPFSEDKVHFSKTGVSADLIITVDTIQLSGLGTIYEKEKELFEKTPIIAIDRHPNNVKFGEINVIDPSAPATAQIMAECINNLGVSLTEDMATNLLNALYSATDAFQSTLVTARTFEVAASCRRANGRKFDVVTPKPLNEAPEEKKETVVEDMKHTVVEETKKTENKRIDDQAPADWLKPKIFKSSSHP
jgi:nanoRNase/pAp phosphatase (c-di-AMP/oligoRNAs hydrolase)